MKSLCRRLTWVNCIIVVIAVDMTTLNAAHPDSRTEQKVREKRRTKTKVTKGCPQRLRMRAVKNNCE